MTTDGIIGLELSFFGLDRKKINTRDILSFSNHADGWTKLKIPKKVMSCLLSLDPITGHPDAILKFL